MALKRVELTNPHGCLGAAADDEPIFVLRANDELAPHTVRRWAWDYRQRKKLEGTYNAPREAKFKEAMALADQMEEWKRAQTVTTPHSGD
jgi:hypothetical protein